MKMPRFDAAVIAVVLGCGLVLGAVPGIQLLVMIAVSVSIATLYGTGVYFRYYR